MNFEPTDPTEPTVTVQVTDLIDGTGLVIVVQGIDPEGRTVTFGVDYRMARWVEAVALGGRPQVEVPESAFLSGR